MGIRMGTRLMATILVMGLMGTTGALAAPDSTPPTVSLQVPVYESGMSGFVDISAKANDNSGVARVEFWLNDQLVHTAYVSPYQYTWDTEAWPLGPYVITAIAYDFAGNSAMDRARAYTVDPSPPSLTVTSPAAEAKVSGIVTVLANVSDNRAIEEVEFMITGDLAHVATSAPFQFVWDTTSYPRGSYHLKVVARDTSGNTTVRGLTVYVTSDVNGPSVIDAAVAQVWDNLSEDAKMLMREFLAWEVSNGDTALAEYHAFITGETWILQGDSIGAPSGLAAPPIPSGQLRPLDRAALAMAIGSGTLPGKATLLAGVAAIGVGAMTWEEVMDQ